MTTDEIKAELWRLRDEKYCDFQSKLIPTVEKSQIIGVRTPQLRKFAKQLAKSGDTADFLGDLPHKYFDENQLHAFIISEGKSFEKCAAEVDKFLPFVDNWATCDQLSPKIFRKHHGDLLPYIKKWLASDKAYTVRFAIGMLMEHFLGEDFDLKYPKAVAEIRSSEYYVNMMIAWYFATALAKQYTEVLTFFEETCLEPWTHNKAIQKAVESRRISDEQKVYLRSLKIKKA